MVLQQPAKWYCNSLLSCRRGIGVEVRILLSPPKVLSFICRHYKGGFICL